MSAAEPPTTPQLLQFEAVLRLAVALLLAVGCWLVLRPFFSAILFAAVIAVSTRPQYHWLRRRLGGREPASALLACLVVTALVMVPAALIAASIGEALAWLLKLYDDWTRGGLPPLPDWLATVPLVGPWLLDYWQQFGRGELLASGTADYLAETLRGLALNSGRAAGNGLLQIGLALLVLYYLYVEGDRLAERLHRLASRIGGSLGPELLATARNTVVSVMVAIAGTAMAQAMVAVLGFSIAGVPAPLLLGAATFLLSMVPIGPPLIWGGAALWLFRQGDTGWAVFMVLYGMLCISTVDNVVKPFLISRGSHLPFVVTLLGVLGGLAAFGLIGLFLGPAILALTINLSSHWLALIRPSGADHDASSP